MDDAGQPVAGLVDQPGDLLGIGDVALHVVDPQTVLAGRDEVRPQLALLGQLLQLAADLRHPARGHGLPQPRGALRPVPARGHGVV